MTASVTSRQGQRILRMERSFSHPVHHVWQALTTADQLSTWWPMRIRHIPLHQGAPMRFYTPDGMTSTGVLTHIEPEHRFTFIDEGGIHTMDFELTPQNHGTLLTFTHTFPGDQPPAPHASVWHLCFDALAALLAGHPIPDHPYDETLQAHYEKQLGQP